MGISDWFRNWRKRVLDRQQMQASQSHVKRKRAPGVLEPLPSRRCRFPDPEVRIAEEHALRTEGDRVIDQGTQYANAVRIAIIEGRVTVSTLQRRMRIGFGRACMLVERMRRDGIVDSAGNMIGSDY